MQAMQHHIVSCLLALALGSSACTPNPPQPPRERMPPARRTQTPPPPPDPGDEDEPTTWVKKLSQAHTAGARTTASFNLYRIFMTALEKRGDPVWARRLAAVRKTAPPALTASFRRRVQGRIVAPLGLLDALVNIAPRQKRTVGLLLEILRVSARGGAARYGPLDLRQQVVAIVVEYVAKLAKLGVARRRGLAALEILYRYINGSNTHVKTVDPYSLVRSKLIDAVPVYLSDPAARPALERILVSFVRAGLNPAIFAQPKVAQDPMVTILAIRLLGDLGSASEPVTSTLVASLVGKGRGRRFFSFAATALAKLPAGKGGRHPALPALRTMMRDCPFKARVTELKRQLATGRVGGRRVPGTMQQPWRKELRQLEGAMKMRTSMPRCPLPKQHTYLCRIFWVAHVERWDRNEPAVIPMNALMVLREIGDVRTTGPMLKRYGIDVIRHRWLAQARTMPGNERTRDRDLPGVQMQKVMSESYGKDMNMRSVMLHALGRMARKPLPSPVARELLRSLTWAGDPTMMVKAAQGASLAPYDSKLLTSLVRLSRHAASPMMVLFKKRQIKMYFWGKVVRGSCFANQALEQKFKDCLMDPPRLRGQPNDANWRCFAKFRHFWLNEFRYNIKLHRPGELKRLVHPSCRKDDRWYNHVRPGLEKKAKAGDRAAQIKLYACEKNPSAKALAKGTSVKCGEWTVCSGKNNNLCLDGHWQLRLHFHKHAALLAAGKHARKLLAFRAKDIMTPHKLRVSKLPRKGLSAFYDSDDGLYLNRVIWGRTIERARLRKARQILERELCLHRRLLRPALRCKGDISCYAKVVRRQIKLDWEDCDKLKRLHRRRPSVKRLPGWRAQLKALRMLAHLGRLAGPGSAQARLAVQTAIEHYVLARYASRNTTREIREMILLVIDRVASYPRHRGLGCQHPYDAAKKMPCFRALKRVIDVETKRRVKGVWQINRDARNCLGRLARRASVVYRTL